jgi:hypothetical protein
MTSNLTNGSTSSKATIGILSVAVLIMLYYNLVYLKNAANLPEYVPTSGDGVLAPTPAPPVSGDGPYAQLPTAPPVLTTPSIPLVLFTGANYTGKAIPIPIGRRVMIASLDPVCYNMTVYNAWLDSPAGKAAPEAPIETATPIRKRGWDGAADNYDSACWMYKFASLQADPSVNITFTRSISGSGSAFNLTLDPVLTGNIDVLNSEMLAGYIAPTDADGMVKLNNLALERVYLNGNIYVSVSKK